ncbi:MAG: hypothetical protein GY807_21845, partial [Gammaproteobacteria bacterium]|nr:hypothetical protein [Gammaproteobacteria bacterium]
MQKPAGLKLFRGIWHIDKVVKVGNQRQRIRGSTGFREDQLAEATEALAEKVEAVEKTLLSKMEQTEHTFAEAAANYVTSLERRGKDTIQALRDSKKLMPFIGGLPLSHVHQDTLSTFEQHEMSRGISSGTVDRTYHTLLSVLHHAARVLRDGNEPWLRYSVPKIVSPDWEDVKAPYR